MSETNESIALAEAADTLRDLYRLFKNLTDYTAGPEPYIRLGIVHVHQAAAKALQEAATSSLYLETDPGPPVAAPSPSPSPSAWASHTALSAEIQRLRGLLSFLETMALNALKRDGSLSSALADVAHICHGALEQ